MIKNLDKIALNTIVIMSPECNLNCAYCNIAKSKATSNCNENNYLFKDTVQAIEDNSYLENIKKVLQRLKQSEKNIINFEIWGQEPTLLFPYLNKQWKNWGDFFSNLERISFSTNGLAFTEDLANFIIEVDKYASKNIIIEFQYSYDGLYGEEEIRGFDKGQSKVIENFIKLIKILNQHYFTNVKCNLSLHGVLSDELLYKLNNLEQIELFFESYDDAILKIKKTILNKNLNFISSDIIIQNSGKFTTNYGFKLLDFIKSLNRIKDNHKYEFFKFWPNAEDVTRMLFGVMAKDAIEAVVNSPFYNLDDYLDYLSEHKDYFKDPAMCGSMSSCLRIGYDGTVYDCHGSIYDNYLSDESLLKDTIFDQTRLQNYKHKLFTNLITATDEEVEKCIDFYAKSHSNSIIFFMWHNLINQIYLLALAGQASKDYLFDFYKLRRHAFILARNNQCYHALKLMNGSIFLRGNEEIRQICNGVMDLMDEIIQKDIDFLKGRQ